MEKSNQELKTTRMPGRKFSNLAELAKVYDDLNTALIREYYDGISTFRDKKRKAARKEKRINDCAEPEIEIWRKRSKAEKTNNNMYGRYTVAKKESSRIRKDIN